MSKPEKANIDDSSPSVTLTVGELKELIDRAVRKALSGNGYHKAGDLLDADGAAKHLCVLESWVKEKARRGELKSVHLGHYIRFRPEDLDQFIKDLKK